MTAFVVKPVSKTEKEWSLKEKQKDIMEHREYGEFAGFKLWESPDGDVYKVEDINILLDKLIDDIEERRQKRMTLNYKYTAHEVHDIKNRIYLDMISLINKRFGYE